MTDGNDPTRNDRSTDFQSWRRLWAPDIIGEHPSLFDALDVIRRVADTECGVLITGESGTGKELMAKLLHEASTRRRAPFVALNCAAIPETMIEAELFGHVRGSFTGASTSRTGRIAAAEGGTLFLDEIGDMPLAAQAKLLRMLQERTISPVGSDRDLPIDVRVVAATNKNLEKLVAEGMFRADLYYRLTIVPVHLSPLRERADDIEAIAWDMLARANRMNRRRVEGFTQSALTALRLQAWPGNVRQLGHTVERAVVLKGEGLIDADDLGLAPKFRAAGTLPGIGPTRESDPLDLKAALSTVEQQYIRRALHRTNGNRTEAAALLGLNRTTLVEKIRKYAS